MDTDSLVGKILLAVIAAALGYGGGHLRKKADDKTRRKGVATALLAELRPLERMLRARVAHTRAADSTVTISMPVYDHFENDVLLFPAETARLLIELRSFIRDLELTAALRKDGEPSDARAHHYVQLKATAAANIIPRVKRSLEEAGGVPPADPPIETFTVGELPSLIAPAYPNAANLSGEDFPPAI